MCDEGWHRVESQSAPPYWFHESSRKTQREAPAGFLAMDAARAARAQAAVMATVQTSAAEQFIATSWASLPL